MNEVYRLAHNLIDMAEDGAPMNEIADSLMRLKQINEDKIDEAGMMLAIVVPVQLTKDQVVGRYPLIMMHRRQHVKVAVSWNEEQRLRKMGYKTQEEMRHEEVGKLESICP